MSAEDPGIESESLSRRATRGVTATGLSAAVNAALMFVQTLVVAHFLQPVEFGLMSMAMVVIGFAQLFADLGLSSAIVQRRLPTSGELATLYWTNVGFGLVMFALIELAVPVIVLLFREPALETPLRLLGFVFLIVPFGQQHQFLLQKRLRFGTLATISSCGYLAGAVVTIVLAFFGFGIFALVTGQLVNGSLRTVLLVTQGQGWRPTLHFSPKELKGYLGFGLYQTGDRAANYFNVYLVHVLIGSLLGARALGYYTLAFELVFKPIEVVSPIVSRVAFPIFSLIREDADRVKRGYLRVLRMLSTINFPLALGLGAIAPLAIGVFYGERWQPAATFAQVLAVVALLRSSGSPVGSLLLGLGRASWGFHWSAAKMLLQIPGLYLGIKLGGAIGVALAFLVLQTIFSIAAYVLLIRPLIAVSVREYLGCFVPSLSIAIGVAASVRLASLFGGELPPGQQLAIVFGIGFLAFCGLAFVFNRTMVADFGRLIRERL